MEGAIGSILSGLTSLYAGICLAQISYYTSSGYDSENTKKKARPAS